MLYPFFFFSFFLLWSPNFCLLVLSLSSDFISITILVLSSLLLIHSRFSITSVNFFYFFLFFFLLPLLPLFLFFYNLFTTHPLRFLSTSFSFVFFLFVFFYRKSIRRRDWIGNMTMERESVGGDAIRGGESESSWDCDVYLTKTAMLTPATSGRCEHNNACVGRTSLINSTCSGKVRVVCLSSPHGVACRHLAESRVTFTTWRTTSLVVVL